MKQVGEKNITMIQSEHLFVLWKVPGFTKSEKHVTKVENVISETPTTLKSRIAEQANWGSVSSDNMWGRLHLIALWLLHSLNECHE